MLEDEIRVLKEEKAVLQEKVDEYSKPGPMGSYLVNKINGSDDLYYDGYKVSGARTYVSGASTVYIGKDNSVWKLILNDYFVDTGKTRETLNIMNYTHNFHGSYISNILHKYDEDGKEINLIYNSEYKGEGTSFSKKRFSEVYCDSDSHIKLIVGETFACLGSMNITKNSQSMMESLIIYERQDDVDFFKNVFNDIKDATKEMLESSINDSLNLDFSVIENDELNSNDFCWDYE